MSRGCSRASRTALAVISLNWMRLDVRVGVAQDLGDVPGDGLALAIGVRRQVDRLGLGGGLLQLGHHLFLAGLDAVDRDEAVRLVHAELALGQVADVAHGGLHGILVAQELANGLYLGRGLDDNKVFAHDGQAIAIAFREGKRRRPSNARLFHPGTAR